MKTKKSFPEKFIFNKNKISNNIYVNAVEKAFPHFKYFVGK